MDTATGSEANSTLELLRKRRSVVANNIGEPGPTRAELDLILEAAIRVPDHGKIGPWRLQVLSKAAQAMLGDVLAAEFKARIPEANDKQVEFERQRPQRAPVLIVVSSNVNREHSVPESEQMLSCGAVCMNLLNAAVAMGYAAQWLTEWPAYNDTVKQALGVSADQHIVGLMYVGTAAEAPGERVRPDLATAVSYPEVIPVP
ncbi:nitroreductase family protein [Denitrobaculum tricleocarpae]|uniref:Putative NAD(P)H nitroreductase n=1 Tax=Denitrobaculum tricleocarpae TaxID=2591009 RepID=A0A545SZE7_9PROT|nr:nitroreductase [Denitrobaculum tricleocarpae]TQV70320.1 nitroreductase [Denitrobaculum tricleocarpae]